MNTQKRSTVTIGINHVPELINPQCSCSACDSSACFTMRQTKQCGCEDCTSKSCLVSSNKSISNRRKEYHLLREFITKEMHDRNKDQDATITIGNRSRVYKTTSTERDEDMVVERDHLPIDVYQNLSFTNLRKKISSSTVRLSAQIMNVPYNDFEKTIVSQHTPDALLNFPKLSSYDIFQKIKEVYQACSCKICECIIGKAGNNEFCKCKPCECDDCSSYKRKTISTNSGHVLLSYPECDSFKCDTPTCKVISGAEFQQTWGCVSCERIQCIDSTSKPCSCEPCQCIECKPMSLHVPRTLVVAAARDDYEPRHLCQCSPCDCIECSHGYRISSNPGQHEMSTGLSRHPRCRCYTCLNEACLPDSNDTCRCERRDKVMRKPVQSNNNDYDIRTALVQEKIKDVEKRNERKIIAMFTAISNEYPGRNVATRRKCECNTCECLHCSYKEDISNKTVTFFERSE